MSARSIFGSVFLGIVGLIGFTIIFGSWYTINQGERGVILRNGAITGVAQPGLNFKMPWIDGVVDISIRDQSRLYENVETYSRDQQPATLRLSVNYRIPPDDVDTVYSQYGGEDGVVNRLVDRQVYEKTKTVFGQFNAVTAIQERARLNLEVADAIRKGVVGPVTVLSVQIEDITFSDAYEKSIEERMLAEVEVQKLRQNAEREKVQAEIFVIQANAKADAVRAEAEAQADAITLKGNAEATAINARGKALRDNPALVELVTAEKWDGTLPNTMVPGSAVPFINVDK